MKRTTVADKLLEGMPPEFHPFQNELQGLQYQDKPDYDWFCNQLKAVMDRKGYREDSPYDWEKGGPGFEAAQKANQQPFQRQKLAEKHVKKEREQAEEKSRLSEKGV